MPNRLDRWSPPTSWREVVAVDAHTEGEPLRVVVGGFPELDGATVLERRRQARDHHDGLRRALMWEPRGHADMYGCIVGPPVTGRADLSVLFTHNEGFSTMCGHGIIGVVTVLLETGLLRPEETVLAREEAASHGADEALGVEASPGVEASSGVGTPNDEGVVVGIDTPAGFVQAAATLEDGRVVEVAFDNVPSFVARLGARLHVPGVGDVAYDLAYGGAFYAYVSAEELGLRLVPEEATRLAGVGRRIKESVQEADPPSHPEAADLGFLYGTIFVGPPHDRANHSRNVCVFADGEVDRCPTGTGVSGRLALHRARGELGDEEIVVESILGTCFRGRIVGQGRVGDHEAVLPRVAGRAWITGVNRLLVDPADPLAEGFLLG
ncbi:MAG: proline racemase family protein [Longimicrobiales bacterium]|nr:proline racemase family protein [Longimicrobiales bacterium]